VPFFDLGDNDYGDYGFSDQDDIPSAFGNKVVSDSSLSGGGDYIFTRENTGNSETCGL
jgi:hypothetical protein